MAKDFPKPEDLSSLLVQYLRQRAEAHAQGLAEEELAPQVVPFDAAPAQPVDPQLAWKEAAGVAALFGLAETPAVEKAPADWSNLVRSQEPVAALACCFGNYPQMVRALSPLIHTEKLSQLQPATAASARTPSPAVADWASANQRPGDSALNLLVAGVLRVAGHGAAAEKILIEKADAPWQAAYANERAALAWHRGRTADALKEWLAQPDSPPVFFNRGMALLFSDQPQEARPWLKKAVEQIPESDGWHHLAGLYLALAEMRP